MANTKQSPDTRREQERRQRQRAGQVQGRRKRKNTSANNKGWWWFVGIIVVVVIGVIAAFTVLSNQEAQQAKQGSNTAYTTLTTLPAAEFSSVGAGSVSSGALAHITKTSVLKGPTGKPEVLYVGADYCPYCAAQRYIVLAALSRFGTFSNVAPLISSESSIPTFTFHGSLAQSNLSW
jgi:Domain of unknown function (DUF929).